MCNKKQLCHCEKGVRKLECFRLAIYKSKGLLNTICLFLLLLAKNTKTLIGAIAYEVQ